MQFGALQRQIAQDRGILRLVIARGYPPRPDADWHSKAYRQWLSDLPWREIAKRYRAGETQQQLADDLGVPKGAVQRRLSELGVQTRRGFTPQRLRVSNKQLRTMYRNGATIEQLADRYEVSLTTIWRHLNLDPTATKRPAGRPRGHQRTHAVRNWVRNLPWDDLARRYDAGETLASIAAEQGVGVTSVYRHLKSRTMIRVGMRQPLLLPMTDAELVERHAAGVTFTELAAECGVSSETIRRRVKPEPATPPAQESLRQRRGKEARRRLEAESRVRTGHVSNGVEEPK